MLFGPPDLPIGSPAFAKILAADGGVLGHYRHTAASFSRHYREAVRPAFVGLPREVPQDMTGELIALNFVNPVMRSLPEPRLTEVTEMVHWLLSWRQLGAPTFQLSHSVAAAMLMTDPANVAFEDVPWPYDSYMISLPAPKGPIMFTDFEGREQYGRLVVVHRYRAPQPENMERFGLDFIARVRETESEVRRQGTSRAAHVNLTGVDPCEPTYGPWHYRTLVRVVADEGTSVFYRAHWPSDPPEVAGKIKVWAEATAGVDYTELAREDRDAIKAAHRLVANLSLYLATLAENRRPVAKRRRGVDPAKGEEGYDLYDVPLVDPERGHVIKLDPEVREAASAWCREGQDPRRWSLQSRVAVIGHWKNVPYGPLKVEGAPPDWKRPTRRKWIAPYKRGPEATETLAKTYRVDGPKETS